MSTKEFTLWLVAIVATAVGVVIAVTLWAMQPVQVCQQWEIIPKVLL